MKNSIVTLAALSLSLLATGAFALDYSQHGLDWWDGVCGTRDLQSPIDISYGIRDPPMQQLRFFYPVDDSLSAAPSLGGEQRALLKLIYDGQALTIPNIQQVYRRPQSTNKPPFVMLGKDEYSLVKVMFRSISEHTVEGRQYPLEVQLLHKHYTRSDKILAISVFFDAAEGHTTFNPRLKSESWSWVFKTTEETTADPGLDLNLQKLLMAAPPETPGPGVMSEEEIGRYFDFAALGLRNATFVRYPGSMTSPPCAEDVIWLVKREPALIAADSQLLNLGSALFKATAGNGNFRGPMPLAGREFVAVKSIEMHPWEAARIVASHGQFGKGGEFESLNVAGAPGSAPAGADEDVEENRFLPLGANPKDDKEYQALGAARAAMRHANNAVEYIADMKDRVMNAAKDYRAEMENLGTPTDWL